MDHRNSNLLHEQFQAQVEHTPDAVALQFQGDSITYRELDARADAVARALHAADAANGSFIGLHIERSINYVVALLGILKANGAAVPLPPSYPEARLREILTFAALAAVIDDSHSPLDPDWTRQIIHLEDALQHAPPTTPPSTEAPLESAASPDQPAFVLCSSGSTGTPKMIVRSHRSFFHRLCWTWEQHPYRDGEVCVQKSHMTTTHAIYELFEPLLRGVPVHIVSDQEVRDLEAFWETIHTRGVSRLLIVPSVLQASLDMPGFAPPPLAIMVLMGEHVPHRLAGRALAVFPASTRIYTIYGSTEASSTLVCDIRASYQPDTELTLGRPISSAVQALVLDEQHAPVPPGELGMLYITGPALFSAYFKDAERTAAAALIDAAGERLYRTQDQVRVLPDGNLQFVGRIDDTVKVRGFRVDLKEVERAVQRQPDVRQCTVLVDADEQGNASLVAFVTPGRVTPSTVLQAVRDSLPHYMVPRLVIPLNAFPLTASGKVDRRRLLAEFVRQTPAAGGEFNTETERRVAEVWRQVLSHAAFTSQSSFFEVGGTSLTVFAAVHRLRTAFQLDRSQLSDLSIYQYPTLSALAACIDAIREGRSPDAPAADTVLVTLKRGSRPDLPPLFMIASAGGTLGAYEKLVKALGAKRDIIGVRDPYLWGDRDASLGFDAWIARYVDAIRQRQPLGPYYIVAYSSAGAFGYEIARLLRNAGQQVALLALIDPLALDRASRQRFGYWALAARFQRRPVEWIALPLIRLAGWLRRALPQDIKQTVPADGATNAVARSAGTDASARRDEFAHFAEQARNNREHIRNLSALLELNTGLPFALTDAELEATGSGRYLDALLNKVRAVAPEMDARTIENIVVQYELQVRTQHAYQLRPYDGDVVLFEPASRYRGLESLQLRPYVKGLRDWSLEVGAPSEHVRSLTEVLPARIRTHYLCMRDDLFTTRLARELEALINAPG